MEEKKEARVVRKDTSVFIPGDVIAKAGSNPFIKNLAVVQMGFFQHAYHHSIYRDGISEYILLYCVNGRGWVDTGGRKRDVGRGQLILLDAHVPHGYGADDEHPWTIHWVHFIGEGVPELFSLLGVSSQNPVIRAGENPELISLLHDTSQALSDDYTLTNLLFASTCLQQFFSCLLRLQLYSSLQGFRPSDIGNVMTLMQQNLTGTFSLSQLAEAANMSKYHFVRRFREKTGYSPMEYFNRMKIQKACELLATSASSIKEISNRLAFSSPYYFSEVFKRITGYAPREYRTLQRAGRKPGL